VVAGLTSLDSLVTGAFQDDGISIGAEPSRRIDKDISAIGYHKLHFVIIYSKIMPKLQNTYKQMLRKKS
jgi:hypothetical protein